MIAVIRLFAGLPGASVQIGGVHTIHAVAYYAARSRRLLYFASKRRIDLPSRRRSRAPTPARGLLVPAGIASALALAAAFVWVSALSRDDGRALGHIPRRRPGGRDR